MVEIAKEPLVTVITPTHNRAKLVIEAIQSVLAQSSSDFEMLIVDDGSTDDTESRIAPLLADARLKYYYQPNQGQSVARNYALGLAKGDFICFLDSDDSWLPDKLERQLKVFAEMPDVDVVYGDYIFIDGAGDVIDQPNMKRYSGHIAAQMLRDNCVSMNTTMARRRCFDEMGGMSGKRRVADDYDLWLRFSARYRFFYLPVRLAKYRIMNDQLSSDKHSRFEANEAIITGFLQTYPEAVTKSEARSGLGVFYTRKARFHASAQERMKSVRAIARAIRLSPFSLIVWRGVFKVAFPNLTRAHFNRILKSQ